MSTQLADLDSVLDSASKDELAQIARRALDKLFAMGAVDPLGDCILFRNLDSPTRDVYLVSPVRPGETIETEEEMLAEVERRAKSLDKRVLTAEEFLALLGK